MTHIHNLSPSALIEFLDGDPASFAADTRSLLDFFSAEKHSSPDHIDHTLFLTDLFALITKMSDMGTVPRLILSNDAEQINIWPYFAFTDKYSPAESHDRITEISQQLITYLTPQNVEEYRQAYNTINQWSSIFLRLSK